VNGSVLYFTLFQEEKYYAQIYTNHSIIELPVKEGTITFNSTEVADLIIISTCTSEPLHSSNFSLG